uniref:CCHC-type domain-containing protein n=1 Tax=Manihot esculenta TaxID=3983 RepID=A0A2C9VA48_MANES
MEANLQQLSLSDEEDEGLAVVPVADAPSFRYENCLVGMFLTFNRINFKSMREVFADIWHPLRGVEITELEAKRYLFHFFAVVDLERVLQGTPWLYNNHLLILHALMEGEDPLQVPLIFVDEWVQVHDLKIGFYMATIAINLGNFVGSFLDYDTTYYSSNEKDSYMRIRVRVDVRNPLKRRKKLVTPTGEAFYARFAYERFMVFCFFCGRLGHTDSFCGLLLHKKKELQPLWGPELRAVCRRNLRSTSSWLRVETPFVQATLSPNNQDPSLGRPLLPSQSFLNSFLGTSSTTDGREKAVGQMETDQNHLGPNGLGEDDPMQHSIEGKKRQRSPIASNVFDAMDSLPVNSTPTVEPARRVDRQP